MSELLWRKVGRIFAGICLAAGPLLFGLILSAALFQAMPNIKGLLIIAFILIGCLFLGIKIFQRVQIVGINEFLATPMTSPELDNLIPTDSDTTQLISPEEFAHKFHESDVLLNGGSIRVYGDWIGPSYHYFHELKDVEFNSQKNTLSLSFNSGETLEIQRPKHLFIAPKFFKIVSAVSVTFSWDKDLKTYAFTSAYQIYYYWQGKKLKYTSTEPVKRGYYDLSKSAPALVINGWCKES